MLQTLPAQIDDLPPLGKSRATGGATRKRDAGGGEGARSGVRLIRRVHRDGRHHDDTRGVIREGEF